MGYKTIKDCALDTDRTQTPRDVFLVREFAGWTYDEAAAEIGVSFKVFRDAEHGIMPLPDHIWRDFVNKAGRRSFDYDLE